MNPVEAFLESLISVKWGPDKKSVDIIDQTLLPGIIKRIQLDEKEAIREAIKQLRVRGAPAIGVMAAYGLAVLAEKIEVEDFDSFYRIFQDLSDYLASSRPTAVNLFWVLDRLDRFVEANKELPIVQIKKMLFEEAQAIREEDVAISRGIGQIGLGLLEDLKREGEPVGILTHCNAGSLATAKYGTATAPLYMALEAGWPGEALQVYCNETRPLLQGIRLTAFELIQAGIRTTVQCDSMASALMAEGKIDIIFVGTDRVARNGDAANKIGTNMLAILARYYDIPFYVCAPSSTIDLETATGADIPIEIRDPDEITTMWYEERMAPPGVQVFNPAFDVTDHSLITGIITEKGLCRLPYEEAFEGLGLWGPPGGRAF